MITKKLLNDYLEEYKKGIHPLEFLLDMFTQYCKESNQVDPEVKTETVNDGNKMKVKFSVRDFENGDITDFVLCPSDVGKMIGDHRLELLNIEFVDSNQAQAEAKPEIAELKKKIEGYKKIVQFILDNHWKFGDMEQQLLTKIEKIGIKYSL